MRISDWSSDVCSSDLLLAPQAVEPHEVAEALRLAVPGILDKAGIGGGKRICFRRHLAAYLVHQDQRARIVVHAIAMVTVRHAIQAVLQYAAAVAQATDGPQIRRQPLFAFHWRKQIAKPA